MSKIVLTIIWRKYIIQHLKIIFHILSKIKYRNQEAKKYYIQNPIIFKCVLPLRYKSNKSTDNNFFGLFNISGIQNVTSHKLLINIKIDSYISELFKEYFYVLS